MQIPARHHLRLIVFVVATFTTTSFCAAEPPQPRPLVAPQYQALKDLEHFIGEWQGEYDPPGSVPKGICHVSAKWAGYKSYVHFKVTFIPGGTDIELNPMTMIIGFNGETKTPYAWDFGALSQATCQPKISADKIVMNNHGVNVRGDERSRTVTYHLQSPNKMLVTNTQIKSGEDSKPDEPELTLTRVR